MERRFHMRTKSYRYFVETKTRAECEKLRKVHLTLFKGMRIKDILQAYPDKVKLNVITRYTA